MRAYYLSELQVGGVARWRRDGRYHKVAFGFAEAAREEIAVRWVYVLVSAHLAFPTSWRGRAVVSMRRADPPCVSESLLGLLIEAVVLKAAHREREFVVRLQRAVGSVKWQDMRGRSSPLQHMQRAGTQSGGTD